MSFVIAAPEAIAAAATDLASIGSTIGAANAAAAANTTAVLAAGADQVSVAIAAAFGAHGQINAPFLAALGRPLIGNGADGAPGTGAAGG
ncbi:PE family protein, partial [Mycobacterium tuberculosis]|uniref:PE family protein n=1 Tax=Mycobacterium tuberculosis TaxID=1773 RepID=UPI00126771E5